MKVRHNLITGLLVAANALCAMAAHADGFIPFFELNLVNEPANDTFYTTYLDEVQPLLLGTDPYSFHGVAAYLPCSTNGLTGPNGEVPHANSAADVDHGYTRSTINGPVPAADMAFPCAKPAGTTALYRFYKGAPQDDHAYITSYIDAQSLEALGYRFDRVEGYVYTSSVAGSVPLYALDIGANIANHEIDRRYTTSASARQSLLNNGWTDDGIIGYVFTQDQATQISIQQQYSRFYNGCDATMPCASHVSISNAVPTTNATDIYNVTYGSENKVRPGGAYWEQISFTFTAGSNLFNSGALNHWPSFVRFGNHASTADMAGFPSYDGVALVIADASIASGYGTTCGTAGQHGGQLYFELADARGFGGTTKNLLCLPHLTTDLQNSHSYTVTFGVGDSADVYITVTDITGGFSTPLSFTATGGTTKFTGYLNSYYSCPVNPAYGTLSVTQTYCANPISETGFDPANTGFMSHVFVSGTGYGTVSQFQAHWLNSSGVILN
jgi:hypothetical protein